MKIVATPKKYFVTINGLGSILMNRMLEQEEVGKGSKQAKEDAMEKERRIWRERAYFSESIGYHVPGENIHECLKQGCRYWGQKIPGAGNKTYTDLVASAIVVEDMPLGIMDKDDERIIPFKKYVNGNPSKGKNSGTKVWRIRPLISTWGGQFLMHVFDSRLSLDVLETILAYSGAYKGLCDWRPVYGRFSVKSVEEVESATR